MKRLALACAFLAVFAAPAFASSTAGTSAGVATSGAGSSASSRISSGEEEKKKVILAARDDAASFVASDGRIRGAQFEAALRYLRDRSATAQRASDMDLARAILAL